MEGARILLVEDDELNQALVRTVLTRSDDSRLRDARVLVAGTLARAREVLAEAPVDLVLLDMGLPDGSGLLLAAEIASRGAPAPPVIALTGGPGGPGGTELGAGCTAVLRKPYRPAQLCQLAGEQLARARVGQAGAT
ncbi:MAG TPA: response regulator [Streptosporangiaceae bacterium]